MRDALRSAGIIATVIACLSFVLAADPPANKYVVVGETQAVVKSPPFTGKNDKAAKRNNTITLTETKFELQSGGGKGGKGGVQLKPVQKDTLYEITPDVVVRWQKLPDKDADGKPIKRTFEEIQKLRGTTGLPGFEADLKDLAANQIVKVRLVRMRGSEGAAAEKHFISRIIIQGDLPAPPNSEDPKKKKK